MSVPLSKVRKLGKTYYLSGELGFSAPGVLAEGGVAGQTKQCLENIKATLAGEGLSLDDVVTATCYLVNPSDFGAFNEVYASYFGDPKPSRTTVGIELMLPEALVEITVIAEGK